MVTVDRHYKGDDLVSQMERDAESTTEARRIRQAKVNAILARALRDTFEMSDALMGGISTRDLVGDMVGLVVNAGSNFAVMAAQDQAGPFANNPRMALLEFAAAFSRDLPRCIREVAHNMPMPPRAAP